MDWCVIDPEGGQTVEFFASEERAMKRAQELLLTALALTVERGDLDRGINQIVVARVTSRAEVMDVHLGLRPVGRTGEVVTVRRGGGS